MIGSARPPPARPTRNAVVIAAGILATGLGWPGLIGRLPFGLLLKNGLRLAPEQVAAFWAVGTLAWYLKPAVGLLCDAWPIFGTRRGGYMLGGAVVAAVSWAAFGVLPRTLGVLMTVMTLLNLGLVVVSVSVGGALVEEGQRRGATGRLSALRTALEGIMQLVAGPLGGLLAVTAFVVTALSGALIVALFLIVALLLYQEPGHAPANAAAVWATARAHFRTIVRSRSMWMTSLLIFLVFQRRRNEDKD